MPGSASPSFGGFTLLGSLAILVSFDFRPMTLRRRVSPVLLFVGADLLSRLPKNFQSNRRSKFNKSKR
jgi:hypothetical protein